MTTNNDAVIKHRQAQAKAGRKRREMSLTDDEWLRVKAFITKMREK